LAAAGVEGEEEGDGEGGGEAAAIPGAAAARRPPQRNTRTPKTRLLFLPGESVEIDTPPPREKLRRGEAAAPAAAAGEGRGCVYNALYSGT